MGWCGIENRNIIIRDDINLFGGLSWLRSELSTWRESLDKNGEGVHHIAFAINGMKDKILNLEKNNMPLLQKGEYKGARYA
jgi:hypothetical protein